MARRRAMRKTAAYRILSSDLVTYAQDVDIRGAVAWLTRYFPQARQH